MSYTTSALNLNPRTYFDFSVVDANFFPVDLERLATISISGPFYYYNSDLFVGKFLVLPQQSSASIPHYYEYPYSLTFWGKHFNQNAYFIEWGGSGDGLAVFYDENIDKIVVNIKSYQSVVVDASEYFYFFAEIQQNFIKIYINAEEIYSGPFNDVLNDIFFGSSGAIAISDLAFIDPGININEIVNLYSLGLNNYYSFNIKDPSSVSFSDRILSKLQTAWQAYGEITTKR
jgi:hypothetical protein